MKNLFSISFLFAILISTTNCNISNYMSESEPNGISSNANSDLPATPLSGKCYVRCITPEKMETYEETYPVYSGGKIDPNELDTLKLILSPAIARWEYKTMMENCRSSDPRDCMVLCYVEQPEESEEIVIVKDEAKTDLFEYQSFVFQKLYDNGGEAVWEEVDCKLTDYNKLPISFDINNLKLTWQDKQILDSQLLKLMRDKPNIRLEISSHTSSLGDADYNLQSSQRRADEVVKYLTIKGIQKSRLVAKGYGEKLLKNNCKGGVDCTELEHAENERTEFRVLSR